MPEDARVSLRHTLATLAYRGRKAVAGAPESFATFRPGEDSRTPVEVLAHVGDVLDWALWMARGEHVWKEAAPLPWAEERARFFAAAEALDAYLASGAELGGSSERLFQGPVADCLTHVGQLTYLRRLAGCPVKGENYSLARIEVGRVGADQVAPEREFD